MLRQHTTALIRQIHGTANSAARHGLHRCLTAPTGGRHPRRLRRCAQAALLLPDISPNPTDTKEMITAARQMAASLSSEELVLRGAAEVAITWAVTLATLLIVRRLRADLQQAEATRPPPSLEPHRVPQLLLQAAVRGFLLPARTLLPVLSGIHTLRTLGQLANILVERFAHVSKKDMAIKMKDHLAKRLGQFLSHADYVLLTLSSIALTAFVVWGLLAWKDQVIESVVRAERRRKDQGQSSLGLERVLLPIGSLTGWAAVVLGGIYALSHAGLNVQPLLTFGGVGGLAIGFGAQAVTSNAISGINLFLTRPFIVGDRIELRGGGGGPVLKGYVEGINPMRTLIRTENFVPVAVPNRAITDMLIANESRIANPPVQRDFKDPRQFTLELGVRAPEDLARVPDILAAIGAALGSDPAVDHALPALAELTKVDGSAAHVTVQAHTTAAFSSNYADFKRRIWALCSERVQASGAELRFISGA